MNNTLYNLQQLVTELNSSNSNNDKKKALANHLECQEILEYIYSPFKKFGVTSANVKKYWNNTDGLYDFGNDTIFELLDSLYKRSITGHAALAIVIRFIAHNEEYTDLIYNIIDKDLKCRIDVSTINKVFPNLIPEFSVALAEDYYDNVNRVNFEKDQWLAQRKLDGLRCITIIDKNGNASFWSRNGIEFDTLDVLRTEIESLELSDIVFDGEICLVDENGQEDFQNIMKEIRKKNHTIENPKYIMFDMLEIEEFLDKSAWKYYRDRWNKLDDNVFNKGLKHCEVIDWKIVKDKTHLTELIEEAASKDWEGLILRKDCEYEGKRTKNLLKVKQFRDAEYIVEGIETGPFRVINESTKLEETVETLTNVFITHKGYKVSVGSGFSLEERKKYYINPELIIGKTITVKYFSETKNQDGGISLRFPTVKKIWENGRDI